MQKFSTQLLTVLTMSDITFLYMKNKRISENGDVREKSPLRNLI